MRIDETAELPHGLLRRTRTGRVLGIGWLLAALIGCGEPTEQEYKNRRELEALLTAISLRNTKELEKDARRIDDRHTSGQLSDARHGDLQEIVAQARKGDWAGAEKRAYEFRAQRPFFK
jgi:hypothetical protein